MATHTPSLGTLFPDSPPGLQVLSSFYSHGSRTLSTHGLEPKWLLALSLSLSLPPSLPLTDMKKQRTLTSAVASASLTTGSDPEDQQPLYAPGESTPPTPLDYSKVDPGV